MESIRKMLLRRGLIVLAVSMLGTCGFAASASAANSFTVNDTGDFPQAGTGQSTSTELLPSSDANWGNCVATDGNCTLRAAIQAADETGGSTSISLPSGTYTFNSRNDPSLNAACPVTGCDANDPSRGDLDVNPSDNGTQVTLTGGGSGSTVINGNAIDRIFALENGGTLSLSGVLLTGGYPSSYSTGAGYGDSLDNAPWCGPYPSYYGGAIFSDGVLNIPSDVVINGNSSGVCGGGIYLDHNNTASTASLSGVTFQGNNADYGAGLFDDAAGNISIAKSSFQNGNTNDDDGGGILGDNGGINVDSTSFSHNSASEGGAIYTDNNGNLNITNSTFTGNQASTYGGAIYEQTSANLSVGTSSFDDNSASSDDGGAIYDDASASATYALDKFNTNSSSSGAGGAIEDNGDGQALLYGDVFDNNSASTTSSEDGGGVYWDASSGGKLTSIASSFVNNTAYEGGALYDDNASYALTLINTTMSSNTAYEGGGMYVDQATPATLTNDTIAFNSATDATTSPGGGIYFSSALTAGGTADTGLGMWNTIIGQNTGSDCGGTLPSGSFDQGYNDDSDGKCLSGLGGTHDLVAKSAGLSAPAGNGGFSAGASGDTEVVPTDAESSSSPTVDAGTNQGAPASDGRGFKRDNDPVDIGAFELTAAGTTTTSTTTTGTSVTVTSHSTSTTTKTTTKPGAKKCARGKHKKNGKCVKNKKPKKCKKGKHKKHGKCVKNKKKHKK